MAEVAGAIGVVNGLMWVWSFIGGQMPPVETPSSNYRVVVGLENFESEGKKLHGSTGEIETIKVYNGNHELIGAGGGYIVSGEREEQYADMLVEQFGDQQIIWTEFFAGEDAICIAAITATMHEETQWGWTGDWGYVCGLDWFPSGYAMKNRYGLNDVSPRCTWIDKDHTNGIKAGIIGIKWDDPEAPKEGGPPSLEGAIEHCGGGMQAWANDGEEQMLPLTSKPERFRSSVVRRSQRSDNRLVVSKLPGHNATEVCASDTSWGPDFVSEVEGIYCNMETHKTVPLCGDGRAEGCFDLESPQGPAMVNRNGKRSTREFSRVIKWGY